MRKRKRLHSSDEFGQSPSSGSQVAGADAPMIGAAAAIMVDALTERESGVTPPPPPVSLRTLAIALGVMFAIGATAIGIVVARQVRDRDPIPVYTFEYSVAGTGSVNGTLAGGPADTASPGVFQVESGYEYQVGNRSYPFEGNVRYDPQTVWLLDGGPLDRYDSGSGALTPHDLDGFPCSVQYRRVAGSDQPLAVLVDLTATLDELQQRFGSQ